MTLLELDGFVLTLVLARLDASALATVSLCCSQLREAVPANSSLWARHCAARFAWLLPVLARHAPLAPTDASEERAAVLLPPPARVGGGSAADTWRSLFARLAIAARGRRRVEDNLQTSKAVLAYDVLKSRHMRLVGAARRSGSTPPTPAPMATFDVLGREPPVGEFFVLGGSPFGPQPLRSMMVLEDDGSASHWKVRATKSPPHCCAGLPRMRERRSALAAARDGAGRVWTAGGWTGRSSMASTELLVPREGSHGAWRPGPAMRVPRCFLGLSCCVDGALLAIGGGDSLFQGSTVRRETEILRHPEDYGDDEGDEEDESGDDGDASDESGDEGDDDDDDDDDDDGHGFHYDGGDDNDSGGGGDDDGVDYGDDDADGGGGHGGGSASPARPRAPDSPPSDRGWVPAPPLLEARCGLGTAMMSDGSVYAVGGYGGGLTYHRTVEVLATGGDDGRGWAPAPVMHAPRTGLGVAAGPDGCVYAVGGSPDGSSSHCSAERLDPRVGAWERLPDMDIERGYCAAAFGATGLLVVHGGCDEEGPLRAAECFDPRAMRWSPIFSAKYGPRRADHAIVYVLSSS